MMNVSLFVFMVFLALTHAEEPLCSKCSYDEALLEKMIRNEVKFEQLQEKVEASLDRVDSTLKEIQETNHKMREEFERMNQTTFVKVEEFMKDSTDVINQQKEEIGRMSENVQSLYTGLHQNLTESLSVPIIGFKATGVTNKAPSVGEVLVFPTVMSNPGNGYDASTGIFTATVDGLYIFTTQMCVASSRYITASIMVDEIEVGRSFTYDNGVYPCNTGDAIAVVKAGQNVFIMNKSGSVNLHADSARLISFSGALLNKGNK